MSRSEHPDGPAPLLPTVLLVEDDDLLTPAIVAILAGHAHVTVAVDAEGALERLRERRWDLVVADIELPGISGLELVRAARAGDPHGASLLLSGHASFENAVEGIRVGADDFMSKPVEPAALVEKVRELVELGRTRRAQHRQTVLAIGAHPDDVEIGVGGILLRHVAAGHDVSILTLTGGEQGGEAGARAQESQHAAELLGARLFLTDLQDTSVSEAGRTIPTIKRVLDETGATTVYTHTSHDVHQDHRNVHRATLVAARAVPHLFCYQAPSTGVDYQPTRFVAIDGFVDRKLEVIRAYASQTAVRHYLEEDLLRSTARYWARFTRTRYVEPLEVVRDSDVDDQAATGRSEAARLPGEASVDAG